MIPSEILHLSLFILSIAYVIFVKVKYRKTIMEGIKGENKKMDTPELVGFMWFLVIPWILFLDLVMGYELSKEAWQMLDIIVFSVIGGRSAIDIFAKYKNKDDGDDKRESV